MQVPFALLDDCRATPEHPASRLYTGLVREHRCGDPRTLEATWAAARSDMAHGLHAVLLADYEWGVRLAGVGDAQAADDGASCLRVLVFEDLRRLSAAQVEAWLAEAEGRPEPAPAGALSLRADVDEAAFARAVERIRGAIGDGETYQVNYTYRLEGRAHGTPLALYRRLRAHQPVGYGALIALPDGHAVLSCSPELFLRCEDGRVSARPMKGTAARPEAPGADAEAARSLALDVKNRAENLMIVDLLRSDLGRVAEVGSVQVSELFAVEPYATLLQMTSTVEATLRPEVTFPQLLRATFPCGSITGAPKHRTMQLIARLEAAPRGLYTGAIGWVEPPHRDSGRRCGDLCLSVAIRTLVLGPTQDAGTHPLALGVGAGIVHDSVAADEYAECRLKARFLTALDPGFGLFETMRVTRDRRLPHAERHLARLHASAVELGFEFDRERIEAALREALARAGAFAQRLRIDLAHDGRVDVQLAALEPLRNEPVRLRLEPEPLPESPLARFKTTLRARHDEGVACAERAGAFDSLFFAADGRLVEGGRCNVFVRLDGRWWTPPVADGALPGVMRSLLLEAAEWQAGERTLRRADLRAAEALRVCNALRGVLPAVLADPP